MTYWNHLDGAYFYGVYGAGVKALRSLRNDGAVDCALRAYASRRAYAIAQPGDLLDDHRHEWHSRPPGKVQPSGCA